MQFWHKRTSVHVFLQLRVNWFDSCGICWGCNTAMKADPLAYLQHQSGTAIAIVDSMT